MISTLVYRDNRLSAQNPAVETLAVLRDEPGVMLWVDLIAPSAEEIQQVLAHAFQFHPLAIEDCVSDAPFPKIEPYGDYVHLVMHAVDYTQVDSFMTIELDFFLGKNFLVTYHRQPLRVTETVRERLLRTPSLMVRGPDRFAHTILDLMVEGYKPALEFLREQIEEVAEHVLHHGSADELFPAIVAVRKQLARLRQIVRPQRAVVAELAQGKSKLIRKVILPYLRDLEEELGRIEAQAASWADQLIITFRLFINKSSHEANAGIRVMTAITALTIPSLLIGGWLGMNFENMPEFGIPYGYPITFALTLASTGAILLFMRRKKWL
ncbi:magnesium transporter CorA family protein [Termitidicoccus mucosus]|uniref:Magnesium transporter n=1 Tax=Termitidicoccus mucosus TaxID=1184151 RepID=A0A178IIJ7_9BACT|nr:magnesium transporter [Opitutaceae bacterium TSB47]